MTDAELRELCRRFFDGYERHRLDEVAATLADDFTVWMAPYDRTMERADWLQASVAGWSNTRRRIYIDRNVDTFDCGFLHRYTLHITEHSGRKSTLEVAIVAECRDGKIVKMSEYIDPSKSPAWEERKRREAAAAAARETQSAEADG
jgi:ketosteroid isomerase-like protein